MLSIKCSECGQYYNSENKDCPFCNAKIKNKTQQIEVPPKQINDINKKQCTYCAMMIPQKAKICPYCQKKMPLSGGVIAAVIIISTVIIVWAIGSTSNIPSRTPSAGSNPAVATDDQIYREYEICMNYANEKLVDDKLRGQEMAVNCFGQLKKYGEERSKKVFVQYHEYYGLK